MKAAWYPDPTGHGELRYWDGNAWTLHIAIGGVTSTAPLTRAPVEQPVVEQPAAQQPVVEQPAAQAQVDSGAEVTLAEQHAEPANTEATTEATMEAASEAATESAPAPASEHAPDGGPAPVIATEPVATGSAYQNAAPPTAASGSAGVVSTAGISGELIDGRYAEIDGVGPANQNSHLLRVRLGEEFMARQGSMVAYQGQVDFAYQGGGASRFIKKAFTGEGLSLMRVSGTGDVFLANSAYRVHLLRLQNSGISINGSNVLAFGGQLDWNVERVKGASMMTGGLFNTTLRGTGWVAITTDGTPVVLDASGGATYADSNAIVAWSADLATSARSTMTAGAMIGRGSGEALQVSFAGNGFVIVQPSEGPQIPTTR